MYNFIYNAVVFVNGCVRVLAHCVKSFSCTLACAETYSAICSDILFPTGLLGRSDGRI